MSITDKDMQHLKTLARLELSDDETQHLKQDLNAMLGYFDQIKDLDTEGVEELARPIATFNVFRDDTVAASLAHEEAIKLSNENEAGYFKVPRTVDSGVRRETLNVLHLTSYISRLTSHVSHLTAHDSKTRPRVV
jgi:aspartyl-tRNA(Asn)/glutamyl-tRNA(Gln) amidotransferase subunit C